MKENKLEEIYKEVQSMIQSMKLPMVRDFVESDFNKYIIVGFQPFLPTKSMIGRVVQVREEWGCFGSNQVFIREFDGNLQCHENQWFYKVPDSFIKDLDEIFDEYDVKNRTYSLKGKQKRKGFIIKSKVKEGETTPMREVRSEIMKHLDILNHKQQ